jgi:hypothetical protein
MISRIAVTAIAVVLLAGCSTPSPTNPTDKPITSTLTCQQFSQAASVILVTTSGNDQETVTDEELQSELERAKAMLDAIDVEPETDLAEQVAALEPLTPSDLGDRDSWGLYMNDFEEACLAHGDELTITAPGG